MRALWPDLSYIRAQLRSDSVEVDSLDQIEFSEQLSATPKLEMPPAIADLVHRTVSAQQIGMNRPEIGVLLEGTGSASRFRLSMAGLACLFRDRLRNG